MAMRTVGRSVGAVAVDLGVVVGVGVDGRRPARPEQHARRRRSTRPGPRPGPGRARRRCRRPAPMPTGPARSVHSPRAKMAPDARTGTPPARRPGARPAGARPPPGPGPARPARRPARASPRSTACGPPASGRLLGFERADARPRRVLVAGIPATLTPPPPPTTASRSTRRRAGRAAQTSMTTGMTAGRRRVRSLMNLPSERRAWRRSVSKSVAPSSAASCERGAHRGLRLLEQLLGLGRVHPAAGDDLGAGDDLAGRRRRR